MFGVVVCCLVDVVCRCFLLLVCVVCLLMFVVRCVLSAFVFVCLWVFVIVVGVCCLWWRVWCWWSLSLFVGVVGCGV